MRLGQPAPTLSGGEAQRVKLASELQKRSTGRTVYVLDEPTTGLHFEDIRKLLVVLESLVDKGNTVIVIEHNLDVIKTADWVIDMGPEGGHRGGTVVAVGTPEEVADTPESYTGEWLRHVLGLRGKATGGAGAAKALARAAKANGGAKSNGAKSNGARSNGAKSNGARSNGARSNGAKSDGAEPDGDSTANGEDAVGGVPKSRGATKANGAAKANGARPNGSAGGVAGAADEVPTRPAKRTRAAAR